MVYKNRDFIVAGVHLIRLDVVDSRRMDSALRHLQAMVAMSRQSWQNILAEQDNDREWIPNANQNSVIPATVTTEIIQGWQTFLDEAELLLAGRKLAPNCGST